MVMGHWGRSHAARKAPPIDPAELEGGPIPQRAECSKCETPVILAGGKLPRGWVEVQGEAVCPDCAWNPTERQPSRQVATKVRHVSIGDSGTHYSGCRIFHEFHAGFVGLRIHGGAAAIAGRRDEPVHFMLDRRAIGDLIQHLCDIQKELPNG